jgi:hypothetical protein
MTKKTIGPFHIVGADDPAVSAANDVCVTLHDDQQNALRVAFKPDLLQVIFQQLVAAAKQAEAGSSKVETYLPVVVEASKATVVQEPGQGLFLILEVNDGLAYIFPLGPQLATVLRDQLSDALDAPFAERTMN